MPTESLTETLTEAQARAIALSFLDGANAISNFLHTSWPTLTPVELQKLDAAEWDLRTNAYNFRTMIVGMMLTDLQPTVQQLLAATADATKTIKHIADATKAIKIATAFVILGGAITSQNPIAIVGAVGTLAAAIKP